MMKSRVDSFVFHRLLILLAIAFTVTACGGGSSSTVSTPTATWSGTKQLGVASANTLGYGGATDSSGNVFVTGYTKGNLDGITLTGTNDMFITKYDSSGTKKWTTLLGVALKSTTGQSITTDSSGNIFVSGYTYGDLDGNTLTGTSDLFVTKYDSAGTKLWTKQLGVAAAYTFGRVLATDGSGNIFVAGRTTGGLDSQTLTGTDDLFVTKYDSSGTKLWTKQLGVASAFTAGYGVATDSSGNVFVSGSTDGGLDGNTLTGTWDLFVTKYDSSGTKLWTKQLGVASADTFGRPVATDGSGNIFVAGSTNGGLDGNTLTGTSDFILTKYDSSGTRQWTKQLGAASADTQGIRVVTDGSGNIFVAGNTDGSLDGNTLTGTDDFFVTKYDSSGTKLWTKQLGVASASTYGYGMATDSSGSVFVSGYTYGDLDGNTLTGTVDFFVTKYDSSGTKQ